MKEFGLRDETALAEQTDPFPTSFKIVSLVIAFPANPRGMRILDIGSGISDCVSRLSSQGAYAVGVDYRYMDFEKLEEEARAEIEKMGKKKEEARLRVIISKAYSDQLDLRSLDLTVSEAEKAVQRFNARRDTLQLIPALATHLPFADESFDFVYSNNCITSTMLANPEVSLAAIQEAVRVLKNGRELQLSPLFVPSWPEDLRLGLSRLINYMEVSGMDFRIQDISNFPSLVVKKS